MAQHESWDPKPFASPDYRGPFSPIKGVTGEYVGEKFANIAKILDKISIIRSVTHEEVTQEDLGGARAHSTKSGVCHLTAPDEHACLDTVRELLGTA